jgi:hypothetical protein
MRSCPEEVDGGRPAFADQVASLVKVAFQFARGFCFGILCGQSNAHGCRHADRRRSTHHHGPDDVGNLLVRLAGDVGFFRGQLRLIDKTYALFSPLESLNHEI